MGTFLLLQVWNHLDAGLSEDKTCFIFKDREKWEYWQRLQNCVKSPAHLSMWTQPRRLTPCDMLIFPLSGFTFHTLSSLGVLGTGDLKWLRAERDLREIQLTLCASPSELQLLYSCVMQRTERERKREIGRCWERGENGGREKEQERGRAGSPGFLSHPLRHPVLSLTHRPTFYLTYLAPAFNIIRHSVYAFIWMLGTWCTWFVDTSDWQSVAVLSSQRLVSIAKQHRSHMTLWRWVTYSRFDYVSAFMLGHYTNGSVFECMRVRQSCLRIGVHLRRWH